MSNKLNDLIERAEKAEADYAAEMLLTQRYAAEIEDLKRQLGERENQVDYYQQSIDNITVACGSLGLMESELPAHIKLLRANDGKRVKESMIPHLNYESPHRHAVEEARVTDLIDGICDTTNVNDIRSTEVLGDNIPCWVAKGKI